MSQIEKIIYINLDRRTDRKEDIENELKKYNLEGERFSAYDEQTNSVGCLKSHLAALRKARDCGYSNVLILEDDFTFLVDEKTFREHIDNLFTCGLEFDVCMLGYNLMKGIPVDTHPFLTKVYDAQTCSAYLVTAPFYDKLIALYEETQPLLQSTGMHWLYACDQIWKKLQPDSNWYCFTERIGYQKAGISDNTGRYEDYGV